MKTASKLGTAALLFASAAPVFAGSAGASDQWYASIRRNDLAGVSELLATADVNTRDDRGGTPLLYAAAAGSPEIMGRLIASGADVNARNAFGLTPLMISVAEPRKVRLLLDHAADVNAKSALGRTPLLLASMVDGASATVRLLIDRGAALSVRDDATRTTPLIAATAANDTRTVELLLARGAAVNDRDAAGITPLMNAAGNGNVKVMRELLDRGAKVNVVTEKHVNPPVKNGPIAMGSLTPLMFAAATGGSDAVKLLLDRGAQVDARDIRGMTPLQMAVATDHADPRTIESLIAHGADPHLKDNKGEDAVDWARKFSRPDVLRVLRADVPVTRNLSEIVLAAAPATSPSQAVAGSIELLQRTGESFLKEGGCVACHAQNLTAVAVRAAKAKGIGFDESIRMGQQKSVEVEFASADQMLLQRMDPPVSDIMTYAFLQSGAGASTPSRATDAMIHNLAAQQRQNGSWQVAGINRPPVSDGGISRTAMAIHAIRAYGPAGRAADLDARVVRAAAWLEKANAITTEDRVMRLLGLRWAGQPGEKLASRVRELLQARNNDGGWAQTTWLASDAYATGQALYALHELGVPVSNPAYRGGVDFLMRTRKPDGSWHVVSRTPGIQPYFESGFPYGRDQWISSAATAWATAAIAYSLPDQPGVLSAQR